MQVVSRPRSPEEGESGPTYLNERALGLVDNPADIHHRLGQRSVLHLLDAERAGMNQRQRHVPWKRHSQRGREGRCGRA